MSVDGEGASRYFDRALTAGDYYASQVGVWGGKGCERLGLAGDVSREDFIALSNKVPRTGEQLTVRKKENRRAGYDFTFSVPKSNQHLAAVRDGVSSLIVAPTHAECRTIAERVREQLKAIGLVGLEDSQVRRWRE